MGLMWNPDCHAIKNAWERFAARSIPLNPPENKRMDTTFRSLRSTQRIVALGQTKRTGKKSSSVLTKLTPPLTSDNSPPFELSTWNI